VIIMVPGFKHLENKNELIDAVIYILNDKITMHLSNIDNELQEIRKIQNFLEETLNQR